MSDDKTRHGKRNSMHEIPGLTAEDYRKAGKEPPPELQEQETISSARGMTKSPKPSTSGRWSLAELRLTEELARVILMRRFTAYGARIQEDFSFHEGSILCTLDGYDPDIRVGYVYISHADEDIVTDIDSDTELAFHELAMQGRCYVMVIHDSNVKSNEQLAIYVDQFLHGLPPSDDLRSR